MKSRLRCDWPVTLAPGVADTCGKPAVWVTDDLKEIHNLCAKHCDEAMTMNDFETDPVDPCQAPECPEHGEWRHDNGKLYCRAHAEHLFAAGGEAA